MNTLTRLSRVASELVQMRLLFVLLVGSLALSGQSSRAEFEQFASFDAASETVVDHTAWDQLLQAYVKPDETGFNRVDYASFKSSGHAALKNYVKALEGIDPTKLNRNEQFAYWANLYNAKTIDVVLDAYPVNSIREISIDANALDFFKSAVGLGGPWKAKIITVNGQQLSLDNVEHDIMRKVYRDPRVHYAVNCASIGCPNLNTVAFTGSNLEAELEAGARKFINHPRGIAVLDDGTVVASSIYSWFQVDFGGSETGVLDHVRKYAEPGLLQKLEGKTAIARFEYDWSLNDVQQTN